MTAFVDTNILVRHLTGDPPEMAARATAYLRSESGLLLTDLVAAETVYVLESFYEAPRDQVAQAMRSLLGLDRVSCVDSALLLRAIEVYETDSRPPATPTGNRKRSPEWRCDIRESMSPHGTPAGQANRETSSHHWNPLFPGPASHSVQAVTLCHGLRLIFWASSAERYRRVAWGGAVGWGCGRGVLELHVGAS
jgi:predicted nucleic-acid-binding protein